MKHTSAQPSRDLGMGTFPAELDLRDLPSPEPMHRALAAADALQPGQTLQVLTPMMPTPLLEVLASRGLQVTTAMLPSGGARVLIHYLVDDGPPAA